MNAVHCRYLVLAFAITLLTGCADLPKDPEHTLERVNAEHRIRIGLSENPPWVIRTAGEPRGAEVQLMREFARELGAQPQWFWGNEQQHMEALKSTSWKSPSEALKASRLGKRGRPYAPVL